VVLEDMQKFAVNHSVSHAESFARSGDQVLLLDEVKEPAKKKMKLFSFMQTPASSISQNEEEDLSIKMRQELVDYVKLPVLDYDSDPLVWWK